MNLRIGRNLERFHHMMARRLEGMQTKWYMAGWWEYPPLDGEMSEVVIEEVESYVFHRHNTIAHYIMTCPILELYLTAELQIVAQVSRRRQEKYWVDL